MTLSDIYRQALLMIPRDVPVPEKGGVAPTALSDAVKDLLNLLAWAGTAAGVVGVLACGTVMAMSFKRGEGSEHMSRLGLVLGGCVMVASAGPLITWFFAGGTEAAGTSPTPTPPAP
ncbi:hypothetical protein ACIBEF_31545 [Micromonospora sp. NPDC050795]|uniref:hypothetical protein n=1 Tax=Micromonospora sp. NPDC050795 TaxID=3364282 RepID=UPI0037B2CAC5